MNTRLLNRLPLIDPARCECPDRRKRPFSPPLRPRAARVRRVVRVVGPLAATTAVLRAVAAGLLVSLTLALLPLRAQDAQALIATLRSNADPARKWAACQRLRVLGATEAIPALAGLLTDPAASQAARYTLEGLPGPEADAALREALGKTSGLLKVGVIDSLGWRGDLTSVPLLTPLVADADPAIAAAAATSSLRVPASSSARSACAAASSFSRDCTVSRSSVSSTCART